MVLNFLWWLLIVVDVVHGGVQGLEDCSREVRCERDGPAIRFPFRLKGRQPSHFGYKGFDLSCTKDNQTVLDMPSSAINELLVKKIDYASQQIELYNQNGCWPRQIFDLRSDSFPFTCVEGRMNCTLFSCPPSTERDDQYLSYRLKKLSPCPGNHSNQIYAVCSIGNTVTIDEFPLVSCTKMQDYTSVQDIRRSSSLKLYWSKPSCEHCEKKGKTCRLKNEFADNGTETECSNVPIRRNHGRPILKILGTCALSVVVIVTSYVIYYVYSSNKLEKENQQRMERFLDDYKALVPSRYSYADIKRMTTQFKDKLGQGAYGTVYKGKLSTELLVAVKILNTIDSGEKGEDFINEVGTMGQIHHVNVVRLVGFCADGFVRALVYEFLPNGSLQNFLSSADETSFLGWDKLQDIGLGIAKGIEYLHQGCDQRILHFDIKPNNVLLDKDLTPKVSDFGLAKLCSKDQSAISMTTARGTMGYIAPEVFSRNFGNVSYKADVYSFGRLLLEMVGGRRNFKAMEDSTNQVYFPEWIYNLLERGNDLRIHIEDEGDVRIARKLAIVGLWCIQWHPVDRPSMQFVAQMLEGEGDNLIMPPNPFASTSN